MARLTRYNRNTLNTLLEFKSISLELRSTGCTNKKLFHRKILYFSQDSTNLNQNFRIYPANFIETTSMVKQTQQFKL